MRISLILATTRDGIIGVDNKLPWEKLAWDMVNFTKVTTGHPIIMGKNTFFSIPEKYRPLPHRTNIVLSSSLENGSGYLVAHSPEAALELARQSEGSEEVFICGGKQVYEAFLPLATRMYLTTVDCDYREKYTPSNKTATIPNHLNSSYILLTTAIRNFDLTLVECPVIDREQYVVIEKHSFPADAKNQYGGVYEVLQRKE